jgi:LysM repeat protein
MMKATIYTDKHGKKMENGKVWYTVVVGQTFEVREDPYYVGDKALYRINGGKHNGYGIYVPDTIEPGENKFKGMPAELFEL